MNFTIISPTRVEVDGKDAGNLVDFILGHAADKALIAQALAEWHGNHVKEDQRREKALEDAKEHLAKLASDVNEALAFKSDAIKREIHKAIDRILSPEDAKDTLNKKRKAELQAQLAELA